MWLILSYTVHLVIPKLCTKFIILSQIVPEKSLTEKSLQTNQQTNTVTEKAKTMSWLRPRKNLC